ncbi:hypothetical protein BJV78DRAFT_1168886 [Lactifluus subvellereus]|nr:hypothetical protein BJV78DRAFT_1168886 [Lactifluus subvellereus]
MTDPWPQWLVNSFLSANQPQYVTDESVFYGPYTRLLSHLFGIEAPFEISYDIPQTTHESFNVIAFLVTLDKCPVFFIEVKPPASLSLDAKRRQADDRMRDHFRDLHLRHSLLTPRLPGISAFGTHMAFYEYVVAENRVTPRAITPDPHYDVAPVERWNYNILDGEGINRMHQVVQDVKAMCQALEK